MSELRESELLSAITQLADQRSLLWHHCGDSRPCKGARGFPDLIVVGKYGIIFAELKVDSGDTTPLQDMWLYTLNAAVGRSYLVEVSLWRPDDLASGRIAAALNAISVKPTGSVLKNGRSNYLPGLKASASGSRADSGLKGVPVELKTGGGAA